MKTAKQMFENLKNINGYNVVEYENNNEVIFYRLVHNYYYDDWKYHLKGVFIEIAFDKENHFLNIRQEDCDFFRTITSIIDMEIYKAINKQIEELGWLNN